MLPLKYLRLKGYCDMNIALASYWIWHNCLNSYFHVVNLELPIIFDEPQNYHEKLIHSRLNSYEMNY